MKRAKLLTFLLSLVMIASAAGSAIAAFAAEDAAQPATTTLAAFNQVEDKGDGSGWVNGWSCEGGKAVLTEDEKGAANEAVELGMLYQTWGEWTAIADVLNLPLSTLQGQTSLSFTFFVENMNYLKRIIVNFVTASGSNEIYFTPDANANLGVFYDEAAGKRPGNDVLGVNRNGWQTVSADLSDIAALGRDLSALEGIKHMQVTFVATNDMTVKFSDISASTEKAVSDGVLTSFEYQWGKNYPPMAPWGLDIKIGQNKAGENSTWEVAAGSGGGFNYLLPRPIPMEGFNGIHVRLYVEELQKLDHIILFFCDNSAEDAWTDDYKINITPFLAGDGWQDIYIPLSFFEMSGVPDMIASRLRMETKTYKGEDTSAATSFALDLVEFTVLPQISVADGANLSVTHRDPVDLNELFAITDQGNFTLTAIVTKDGEQVEVTENSFTPASDGSYEIELVLTPEKADDMLCNSIVATFQYSVDATAPSVQKNDVQVSEGQKVSAAAFFTVEDSIDAAPSVTYTVKKDGQEISLGEDLSFTAEIGTYSITAVATDAAGNVSEPVTAEFTVADKTNPVISIAQKEIAGAVGTQIDLSQYVRVSDNVTDAEDIVLEFSVVSGISEISLTDGTKFTPAKGGIYSVTVKAADEAGNDTQDTFTITVPDTVKPVISGMDDVSKTSSVGTKISLAAIAAKDDVAANCTLEITVFLGDTEIELADDASFTPEQAGTYTVMVTASDGANTAMETFDITVTAAASTDTATGESGGCSGFVSGIGLSFSAACLALGAVLLVVLKKKIKGE